MSEIGVLSRLICWAVIVVYGLDCCDLVPTLKRWVGMWLGVKVGSVKPFDCSTCMVHHIGVVWLICVGEFSLWHWVWACGLSLMAMPMGSLLNGLRDFAGAIVNYLYIVTKKLWERK